MAYFINREVVDFGDGTSQRSPRCSQRAPACSSRCSPRGSRRTPTRWFAPGYHADSWWVGGGQQPPVDGGPDPEDATCWVASSLQCSPCHRRTEGQVRRWAAGRFRWFGGGHQSPENGGPGSAAGTSEWRAGCGGRGRNKMPHCRKEMP
jgi:hypothetical protein